MGKTKTKKAAVATATEAAANAPKPIAPEDEVCPLETSWEGTITMDQVVGPNRQKTVAVFTLAYLIANLFPPGSPGRAWFDFKDRSIGR